MHIVIFGVSFKHFKLKLRYTFLGDDDDFPWKKPYSRLFWGDCKKMRHVLGLFECKRMSRSYLQVSVLEPGDMQSRCLYVHVAGWLPFGNEL